MKKLEELLEKRNSEIDAEDAERKAAELERKKAEEERMKYNTSAVWELSFSFTGLGVFCGAFMGLLKGCEPYAHWQIHSDAGNIFSYIPQYVFYFGIIGLAIGIICYGLFVRKK